MDDGPALYRHRRMRADGLVEFPSFPSLGEPIYGRTRSFSAVGKRLAEMQDFMISMWHCVPEREALESQLR